MVDGDALPRFGCSEDLVRGLGFFAAPRNHGHRAEEAASALGWRDFRQFLGYFTVEGKLLELWEGEMTKAVVSLHQFSLIIDSDKVEVL